MEEHRILQVSRAVLPPGILSEFHIKHRKPLRMASGEFRMAKLEGNILTDRFHGKLGDQLVLRRGKDGSTIMSMKPKRNPNRTDSEAQLAQQQAFREAIAYATEKKHEPIYIAKAKGTALTPANVAMADYMHPPQILEIDLNGWNGAAGDLIRMRVQDDVKVDQVTVAISDGTDVVQETGQAVQGVALWWEYPVQQAFSGGLTVTVSASDLPGHVTTASERKIVAG
jgi:hypothetical protein